MFTQKCYTSRRSAHNIAEHKAKLQQIAQKHESSLPANIDIREANMELLPPDTPETPILDPVMSEEQFQAILDNFPHDSAMIMVEELLHSVEDETVEKDSQFLLDEEAFLTHQITIYQAMHENLRCLTNENNRLQNQFHNLATKTLADFHIDFPTNNYPKPISVINDPADNELQIDATNTAKRKRSQKTPVAKYAKRSMQDLSDTVDSLKQELANWDHIPAECQALESDNQKLSKQLTDLEELGKPQRRSIRQAGVPIKNYLMITFFQATTSMSAIPEGEMPATFPSKPPKKGSVSTYSR